MKFSDLIRISGLVPSQIEVISDPEITGIFYDSRKVQEGGLFVAFKGQNFDGHDFIEHAISNGAAAIVAERKVEISIDHAIAESGRYALSALSNAFFGEPSKRLKVTGITGTNGKTTTTFLVKSILEAAGLRSGLIGTIEYDLVSEKRKATRTTPEASDLNMMLKTILESGGKAAVMEVSSHALDEYRVEHIDFDVGVFTNLSRDHLDYHITIERYREAKARLFRLAKTAAINADDPHSEYFIEAAKGKKVITYGLRDGDLRAEIEKSGITGTTFSLHGPVEMKVSLRLPGIFNVYNAMAATAAALLLELPPDALRKGLEDVSSVPGRFEVIEGPYFHVVIDYAHTPDALEKLLFSVRSLIKNGCVITVLGAGGDRDHGKRPLMAQAVEKFSDVAIITSDNPRHEDPMKIIRDVEKGFRKLRPKYDPDRKAAIEFALTIAKPGDIIVIAGKGHEDYQVIGDEVIPFSDRDVVLDILKDMELDGNTGKTLK